MLPLQAQHVRNLVLGTSSGSSSSSFRLWLADFAVPSAGRLVVQLSERLFNSSQGLFVSCVLRDVVLRIDLQQTFEFLGRGRRPLLEKSLLHRLVAEMVFPCVYDTSDGGRVGAYPQLPQSFVRLRRWLLEDVVRRIWKEVADNSSSGCLNV